MKTYTQTIENQPQLTWPSDNISYMTEKELVTLHSDLRQFPHIKTIYKKYEPSYRFFGRFTVLASNDGKHWIVVINTIIPK